MSIGISPVSGETTTTDFFASETGPSDTEFEHRSHAIFDGETLAGWEGHGYWFRVETETPDQAGAIVAGRLEERIPHNQFLCTTRQYADFDLRYQVRLVGQGNNAGVQFRSQRVKGTPEHPSTEVSGYQADVGMAWKRSVWGALYDESRRKRMLQEPETPVEIPWTESLEDSPRKTAWVDMRVLCRGPRVQIFVNGTMTVDYTETDESIPAFGKLGLQIHSGPPTEAWYRRIRILPLRPQRNVAP